ncbi:DUF349 domain-containing protein [Microbacterium sp. NPDC055683]
MSIPEHTPETDSAASADAVTEKTIADSAVVEDGQVAAPQTADSAAEAVAPDAEEPAPAEDVAPAEETSPAEDTAPADDVAPAEETAPVEEPAPAEDVAPAEETSPAEDTAPADDVAPVEETAPVEEAADAEVASPAEETTAAEEAAGADEAAVAAPVEPGAVVIEQEWAQVTENGVVSVREGETWRVVGDYPDGTPQEALEYFARKFADLEFKVATLEQRRTRGGASASDLRGQAGRLQKDVVGAAAVGDLKALEQRLTALVEALAEATAEEAAAARAAVDAAIVERTTIVEKAEALAARDPQQVQWKQATAELSELFAAWQTHQQTGPRLPKAQAQALWKRFRDARSTVERHRRAFFAELDEVHKAARDVKNRLIERAEALAPKGEDGIPSYRALLDEWKRAGRAGRKADDALWARFKAAGDALYQARTERDAAEQAESAPRIEARKALLEEAAVVPDTKDLSEARRLLTGIQRRWDEVGRIFPRDVERGLDDQLRRIEQELKQREDADWKRNNPETKARANDLGGQLRDAIEKLQDELAAAEAKGDKRAIADAKEALDARQAWLRAIGG